MSTMTEDSIRYGLELVEWDWAYNARATRLHHPRLMTEGEVAEWCDNGSLEEKSFRMSCGRLLYWPSIPGLFSRLAMPRCGGCCRALGYPPGTGSPKNDDECRPLVEARMVHLFDRGLDDVARRMDGLLGGGSNA